MKNKVCGEPSVMFHGSKYVPGDELNDGRYPFTLCPECMSSETMVIDKCYEKNTYGTKYTVGDKTGETYRRWRDSIFYDKVRPINYRCKDCGCQYTTYEKLESGVRPPVFWFVVCSMLDIHRVSPVYNDAHTEESNKNKEETKMATAYDTKSSGFGIKKVIFNPPATIVFWNDGSKTVVKCSEDDIFDPLAGIAFALMRKVYGKEYRKIEEYAKEYEKLHPAVDTSAMALDSLLDDLADAAMAGYVMSDKEYEAVVSGEKEASDNGTHE